MKIYNKFVINNNDSQWFITLCKQIVMLYFKQDIKDNVWSKLLKLLLQFHKFNNKASSANSNKNHVSLLESRRVDIKLSFLLFFWCSWYVYMAIQTLHLLLLRPWKNCSLYSSNESVLVLISGTYYPAVYSMLTLINTNEKRICLQGSKITSSPYL